MRLNHEYWCEPECTWQTNSINKTATSERLDTWASRLWRGTCIELVFKSLDWITVRPIFSTRPITKVKSFAFFYFSLFIYFFYFFYLFIFFFFFFGGGGGVLRYSVFAAFDSYICLYVPYILQIFCLELSCLRHIRLFPEMLMLNHLHYYRHQFDFSNEKHGIFMTNCVVGGFLIMDHRQRLLHCYQCSKVSLSKKHMWTCGRSTNKD